MYGCPHGHVCGVFGGSHPYLRCIPSLNSDLLREKLYFLSVARLAISMLLSVTLDLTSVVFSDGHFAIVLAFFEIVIFSLSVLMFLFIRVCSVSAISASLFSNGSQMACDHS